MVAGPHRPRGTSIIGLQFEFIPIFPEDDFDGRRLPVNIATLDDCPDDGAPLPKEVLDAIIPAICDAKCTLFVFPPAPPRLGGGELIMIGL